MKNIIMTFFLVTVSLITSSAVPQNWSNSRAENDSVLSDAIVFARVVKLESVKGEDDKHKQFITTLEVTKQFKGDLKDKDKVTLSHGVTHPSYNSSDEKKSYLPTYIIHKSHNEPYDFEINKVYLLFLDKKDGGYSLRSGPYSIGRLEIEMFNLKETDQGISYNVRLVVKMNKKGKVWSESYELKKLFSVKKIPNYNESLELSKQTINRP